MFTSHPSPVHPSLALRALMGRALASGFAVALLGLCAGCPILEPLPAPGRLEQVREPDTRRSYKLYVPTSYDKAKAWPLLVACHGTPPWDTATLQMDEWKGLGEKRGFLVVAPELVGTRGDLTPAVPDQIKLQRKDEDAILAIIRHVRAAHNIDTTRIFITGWSAGAFAALHTGLRHPDVFRAVAVRGPNFDERYLKPMLPFLDHHQPVLVVYGSTDLLRDQALECLKWLRGQRMFVHEEEIPGSHQRRPAPIYQFFRDSLKRYPWLRVVAREANPNAPLAVAFEFKSSIPIERYLWRFGDGTESPVASPTHEYVRPGTYIVRVYGWPPGGQRHTRRIRIAVPRTRIGVPPPATQSKSSPN